MAVHHRQAMVEGVVTRRVRHRYTDETGKVIVVNKDEPLGEGRVTKRRSSTLDAAPVGHMDPGSRKPLAGTTLMRDSEAIKTGRPAHWQGKPKTKD